MIRWDNNDVSSHYNHYTHTHTTQAQTTTSSIATKIASLTPFKNRIQSFNIEQVAQYIRLRGPRKTGFAELAVSKHTPTSESSVSSRKASRDNDISFVSYRKVSSANEIPTESKDYHSSEPGEYEMCSIMISSMTCNSCFTRRYFHKVSHTMLPSTY